MPTIYQVPLLLSEQNIIPLLQATINFDSLSVAAHLADEGAKLWNTWKSVVTRTFVDTVDIVLVGKYVNHQDAYLSVVKALEHSSMRLSRNMNLVWVDSEHLETQAETSDQANYHKAWHAVCTASGIIVPGGFGTRGTEGMMAVSKWARENGTPFLGVSISTCRHML